MAQILTSPLPLQGKERYNFPNPNPFVEDDMDKNEIASVAYRYVTTVGLHGRFPWCPATSTGPKSRLQGYQRALALLSPPPQVPQVEAGRRH